MYVLHNLICALRAVNNKQVIAIKCVGVCSIGGTGAYSIMSITTVVVEKNFNNNWA